MDAGEVRKRLRAAIAEREANATDLSVRLLKRSEGYLSDFFAGRKQSLGAAETALLESALGLAPGYLVVDGRPASSPTPTSPKPPGAPRAMSPADIALTDILHNPEPPETPESLNALEAALDVAIRRLWAFLSPDDPPMDGVIYALVRSVVADYEARKALGPRPPRAGN